MLELPEVLSMANQLNLTIVKKKMAHVYGPSKVHKFCWFNGNPEEYNEILSGKQIIAVTGFGIFVEIEFEGNHKICFNDGVNVRLTSKEKSPKNYQLMAEFEDGTALVFTVAMYGGIILHCGDYENEYYAGSKQAISPFTEPFELYYWKALEESKPNLSLKAFLATEQRFPGIGNGTLQDILFEAKIHPKRQLCSLKKEEKSKLLNSIITVLKDMADAGGRDTEKDLFGNPGGYKTKMSRNTLNAGCPICKGDIVKETYLGGAVYYCPVCQKKE